MKTNARGFIKIILIAVTLFAAASVWYAVGGLLPQTEADATAQAEVRAAGSAAYEWLFTDLGTDDFGMPRTKVALSIGSTAYEIGDFDGSCAEQETDLLPNEKTKVICWWAGAGQEIGVFEDGGKIEVKVGEVDEGDAETEGFRGNFVTKLTL